jgi:hypothetical protein
MWIDMIWQQTLPNAFLLLTAFDGWPIGAGFINIFTLVSADFYGGMVVERSPGNPKTQGFESCHWDGEKEIVKILLLFFCYFMPLSLAPRHSA